MPKTALLALMLFVGSAVVIFVALRMAANMGIDVRLPHWLVR